MERVFRYFDRTVTLMSQTKKTEASTERVKPLYLSHLLSYMENIKQTRDDSKVEAHDFSQVLHNSQDTSRTITPQQVRNEVEIEALSAKDVTPAMLLSASTLFSKHYGVWSAHVPPPLTPCARVRMSPEMLLEQGVFAWRGGLDRGDGLDDLPLPEYVLTWA